MEKEAWKGSITVFLSLSCVLFLCLICAVTESARIQGARTQTANITGMGTFSLLGEFEKGLLERYEIFSLDGTCGSGSFQIAKLNGRLEEYISYNANPKKDLTSLWCSDPWRLALTDCEITEYTLLTDQKGEAFYQQAVAFMKANLGTAAVEALVSSIKDADTIEEKQQSYEQEQNTNSSQISELESTKQQKLEELQSESSENASEETEAKSNPLTEIAKLQRKSTLGIVTWDKSISEKKIRLWSQPSGKSLQKGNRKIEKTYSGLTSNVLFREYLLEYFPNYRSGKTGQALDYQLEYILGGKSSDYKNLKYVVNRLLLLREGMNYSYCASDAEFSAEAESLAALLTGFLGMPLLTKATKHALLLAWAYGESLIDVRVLLDGGKVPLAKDRSTWSLTLEQLGRVTEILKAGAKDRDEGLCYSDYLRLLLHMGRLSAQKMRALDLIQAELQNETGMSGFKVENCVVAVKIETKWECGQMFFRFPQAALGIGGKTVNITQQASMAY